MTVKNPNHPPKGSSIIVEPIRSKKAIENIKAILAQKHDPRDLCLFTLGINTGFRANELLSIKMDQVRGIKAGDSLKIKQSKNKKNRTVIINKTTADILNRYVEFRSGSNGEYLFCSQRGEVLVVQTVVRYVKQWCKYVGLKGNYGSHTLRKTWAYWQYKNKTYLPTLMKALGHSNQQLTLDYMCIESKEVQAIYAMEL